MALRRRFHAYGTAFEVRGDDPALLAEAIARVRPLGWIETSEADAVIPYALRHSGETAGPPTVTALCDGDVIARDVPRDEALNAFEDHAKLQTALGAKGLLFVHAGVVVWRGRAIVLPGRSLAGKSTLVKALVDAGAEYYSDEYAVLDPDGRVHPCPLPLSLRVAGAVRPVRRSADLLGATIGTQPAPLSLIAVTEYHAGARWQPVPVSPAAAFLALMEHTVAAQQPPADTMPFLKAAVMSARSIRSVRGEAAQVVPELLAGVP